MVAKFTTIKGKIKSAHACERRYMLMKNQYFAVVGLKNTSGFMYLKKDGAGITLLENDVWSRYVKAFILRPSSTFTTLTLLLALTLSLFVSTSREVIPRDHPLCMLRITKERELSFVPPIQELPPDAEQSDIDVDFQDSESIEPPRATVNPYQALIPVPPRSSGTPRQPQTPAPPRNPSEPIPMSCAPTELKAALPADFSGEPSHAMRWIKAMRAYFAINKDIYTLDSQ
ncbi:hypothetical protein HD554DRAFT_2166505 [Boletus coccyginus]|nr:hypothetical protein HD554DRAFT_2166505 [Boletus coccyginus]